MRSFPLIWLLLPLFHLFHLVISQSLAQNLHALADKLDKTSAVVAHEQEFNRFDLTCSDKDIFHFTIEASPPSGLARCNRRDLRLNGELVQDSSLVADGEAVGPQSLIVSATNPVTESEHALEIVFASTCDISLALPIPDEAGLSLLNASPSDVTVVTTAIIVSIDGRSVTCQSSFSINHKAVEVEIIDDSSKISLVNAPTLSSGELQESSERDWAYAELRLLEHKKRILEQYITSSLNKVNKLDFQEARPLHQQYTDCTDVKCYISTTYTHAKNCAQMAYFQHRPSSWIKPSPQSPLLTHLDEPQDSSGQDTLVDLKEPIVSSTSSFSSYASSVYSDADLASDPRVIGGLGLGLLSILCCGGLFISIRRCKDPRRKAERAARRDERRRAREYRCLERKKRARDCWRGPWFSRKSRVVIDEEKDAEKRLLVQEQESLLENVAQAEIRRLIADEHDGDAAEEGRAGFPGSAGRFTRRGPESLPTYRSRAGSGGSGSSRNPPSYTTEDEYTNQKRSRSQSAERTPDSSVAPLSPRLSFETLLSDGSFPVSMSGSTLF